jgi:hypothetical protein
MGAARRAPGHPFCARAPLRTPTHTTRAAAAAPSPAADSRRNHHPPPPSATHNQQNQQVDSTVNALAGSLSFSRELHAKNMAAFAEAKAEYFKYVEAGVSALSRAANPLPYATAAADALRAALDKAVTVADPDLAVDTVHEAWTRVSAHPLVAKALGIVGPTATTVAAHYSAAHDTVVATPAYKAGYGKVGAALAAAQEGALYRRAKALVYPLVAPVADPLAANFARSRVVKQLAEHIKPQMP